MAGRAIFEVPAGMPETRSRATRLAQMPARGPAIMVGNHPIGPTDGISVAKAPLLCRDERASLAYADELRVAPGLAPLTLPVERVPAGRSRARSRELLPAVGRLPD